MKRSLFVSAVLCALIAVLDAVLPSPVAYAAVSPARRPQEERIAKGPWPYRNEEVSFTNEQGHVRLAGTLSVPNVKGPFPAVLLIAASGPEGRDEEAAGHRVFVVLADYLLRKGIAVLRYDKRGVGASTGDWSKASFDDLVSDAAAAFSYLKTRREVDRHLIGVIGHSEGGSIAPAVAARDKDVAYVVAMAGSGLSGEVRITEQEVYLARESGASPEQQARIRVMYGQIFRAVESSQDDAIAGKRIATLIDEAVAAKALSKEGASATRQRLTPDFVRTELHDDPISYLKKVKVPVLALIGTLDRIVPADPYVKAMQPVLNTIPGSSLHVLPNLNHIMQTAQTGSPDEFETIEETISPVALGVIGDWVLAQRAAAARTRAGTGITY